MMSGDSLVFGSMRPCSDARLDVVSLFAADPGVS